MDGIKKVSEEKDKTSSIWDDPELAELLFISEENRENETVEASEAEIEEEQVIMLPDLQDSDLAYELYHKTLQPLLRKALKNSTKAAKSIVRNEVNLLLKDGKKKGRDGKQAYYYRIQQAIDIIRNWEELCATDKIPPTDSKTFRLYCIFNEQVKKIKDSLNEPN